MEYVQVVVAVGEGGHSEAMEAISGLQTAHLPLSPIPAPANPP